MKNYELFQKYLEGNWANTTALKYSRAINVISDELIDAGVISNNIYIMVDIDLINKLPELYRSIKSLYDKDERGNRMYSNALKRYSEFYNEYYIAEDEVKEEEGFF